MKDALKGLLGSKKFLALIASGLISLVGKLSFDVPDDVVYWVMGAGMAFAFGQGMADIGKEKAKIEAAAKTPSGS